MVAMVAVSENLGMMVEGARMLENPHLRAKILDIAKRDHLWMNNYTAEAFAGEELPAYVTVDDDFLEHAGMGQYVLVENRKLKPYMDRVERILLFRWSKEGEVTRKLDVNIERGLLLVDEDLPLADGEQYTIEVWKLK